MTPDIPGLEYGMRPPDQEVPCCMSSAIGDQCTCWVVELVEPQQPITEGPVAIRRKACADCAYRHDSVERLRGEEPNPGGGLIYCHWDAPMIGRLVHPPSGHVITCDPGEIYDPIIRGDRAWKVDGRPQDYCAVSGAINREACQP